MKNFNILILTAFFGRPHISAAYWMGIERLKKKFNVKVLAIVSDKENKELAEANADYILEHENKPIGKKMNSAICRAMDYDFDFLMQLGSDDVISDAAVEKLCLYYHAGLEFFGLNSCVMYDSESGNVARVDYANVFGAGRCISRNVLTKFAKSKKVQILESISGTLYNYGKGSVADLNIDLAEKLIRKKIALELESTSKSNQLWDDEKNSGLDTNSERKIEMLGLVAVPVIFDEPQTLAIKSNENIWCFNSFKGKKPYELDKIKSIVSEKEFDYITKL